MISFLKIQPKSFLLQFLQILSPIVKEIPTHCPPLWENAVRPFPERQGLYKGVGGCRPAILPQVVSRTKVSLFKTSPGAKE